MNAIVAINAYKKIGVESKVIGADPHQLISMLYHGALAAIANAKDGLEHKDIEAKGKAISKAIGIIGEGLHASLDKKIGGEMAQQMSALYDYMVRRLFDANLHNDVAALDEVTRLLTEITEAWDSIRPASAPSVPPNASINAHLAYARV